MCVPNLNTFLVGPRETGSLFPGLFLGKKPRPLPAKFHQGEMMRCMMAQ